MVNKHGHGVDESTYNLTSEYSDLLNNICAYCKKGERILDPDSDAGGFLKVWEGSIFKDFILRDKKLNSEFKKLYEKEMTIKYHTFDVSYGGINNDRAKEIFCLSARVHDQSISEYIIEFVKYCDTIKFPHRGIDKNNLVVKSILETTNQKLHTCNESSDLSLQDVVTIEDEIKKIKKELKRYTYGKSKVLAIKSKHQTTVALNNVDKLLSSSSNNIDLLVFKTELLTLLEKNNEALEIIQKLLKLDSSHSGVVSVHISHLGAMKKNNEALSIAKKYQLNNPESPIIFYKSALLLMRLDRYEEAIDDLLTTISIDEDFVKAYYYLALCYEGLRQYRKSELILKSALNIVPEEQVILLALIKVLDQQGKTDEVSKYIEDIKEDTNDILRPEYVSAMRLLNNGDVAEAEKIMKRLVCEVEDNPLEKKESKAKAFSLLATVLSVKFEKSPKLKSYQADEKYCYGRALELHPDNFLALLGSAETCFLDGEYEKSKSYLAEMSELINGENYGAMFFWEPYLNLSSYAKKKILILPYL